MEIEKTLEIAAPLQRVWELLLDPKVMAGCVPGTQAVEVISDVEYLAEIRVKISFIAARFKVRTKIVEARPPHYLRLEGSGEDASVASSMRQTSELFLTDLGDGRTQVRVNGKADVLGRLGSFGLSVMRTKVDRLWEEFSANLAAVSEQGVIAVSPPMAQVAAEPLGARQPGTAGVTAPLRNTEKPAGPAWWRRVLAPARNGAPSPAGRLATDIYVEVSTGRRTIKIIWPVSAAAEAAEWLRKLALDKP